MSKINAVRLININYNHNAIRISDECFHFRGESTLVSLRNGGGKSVLVQMLSAPFVHKRYRDAKDRPFESYFTTSKPSFILVEWKLDQGAGYVLAGLMIRRNPDISEDNSEELEMISIISEYRQTCMYDIHNLPVVEKNNKEITLKNFTACKQMFEQYKKDRNMEFFCYDMSNAAQARQYFDKLQEYQIHFKEWETIIKKVNLKESGLSDLFSDCRDEKGLVEKWFLDAIESKLNRDRNRMKEFQTILEKYVGQYQDNRSKIQRRDIIRMFKEQAVSIQEQAQAYQNEADREWDRMYQIAQFIQALNYLKGLAEGEHQRILRELQEIQTQIKRIEYEKLSGEIHELEKKLHQRISNRDLLEAEQEDLEREEKRLEQKLHIMDCAKLQEVLEEEQQELETIKQRILASHEKEESLKPERTDLGTRLLWHYREALEENQKRFAENQQQHTRVNEKLKELKEKISGLEQSALKEASREGALRSQAEAYDQTEEWFQSEYGEELIRNILGEYEPGSLDIRKTAYEKELENQARDRQKMKKQQEAAFGQKRQLEQKQKELSIGKARMEVELSQVKEQKAGFDKELEDRKVVLKYLDIEETKLFDLEYILHMSKRKLQEIEEIRKNLEREEDGLQKEYRQLTQGKTLELPKELEEALKNLGLPIVYGMEWLKRNNNTEEENRNLIRSHPFLPYGLILSGKELEKLSAHQGEFYTSFPVPLLIRENLKAKERRDPRSVHLFANVSFYMLFNENLLNEEKLTYILKEKEQQIKKKQEAISLRKQEYQEYFKRQELVNNQTVNQERFQLALDRLAELEQELIQLDWQQKETSEELETSSQTLKQLEEGLKESYEKLEWGKRRLKEFGRLCAAYEQYQIIRMELESCRRRMVKLEEQKAVAVANTERFQEQKYSLETEASRIEQKEQELKNKQISYLKYEEVQKPDVREGDKPWTLEEIQAMEARYQAITSNLSTQLQELEGQEKKAMERCKKAAGQLQEFSVKYCLKEEEWLGTAYDKREQRHQETLLEDLSRKRKRKQGLWVEERAAIAALEQKKKDRYGRMLESCGKQEALPEREIQNQDFDARRNQLQYQGQEAEAREAAAKAKLQSYDENLTALAEYQEFPLGEPITWETDFSRMDGKELRDFKGTLIRDYNQQVQKRQQAKGDLEQILNRIVRIDEFQDDFYRKPLEAMLELTAEPDHVLRQLTTTLQSYNSLMEKLEVDISLVEKEKLRIGELLEDYIREVHQNLDRIDANSTITIRERPVKMLKIQLPVWEENENFYHLRIQDMIDEVTGNSLEILQRNENIQEYLGARITTRNLYDTVIGISNVQIRLYKIEEQREYPITWAEVAKNSGGEGFLSAFVILSSLLYYMRRDEGDLFADRNEGKVLLMDNPFAQTNAAHLLKPLMDMAKKTNTQLICFTGLGGESIYNRFDNIYVLNLIAANLQKGTQYLKGNHLRGSEPEQVMVSRIEVIQQELVF